MTSRPNPYVGPRSFRSGEALYGRDREVQELIDLLIAERVVLLHSPSGAGKSSLLHAALAPAMLKEGFAVRPVMRVGMEIPAEVATSGVNRYVLSCLQSLEEEQPAGSQRPVSAFAGQTLETYLGTPGESELLIFDQFEEILTVDPMDRAGKEAFFAQLGAMLRQKSRWALFAMREDYVAALDQYVRPVPTRLANHYGLKLLEVKAAMMAMREPAASAGVDFRTAAASKLADDLRRVQVQLPDGSMQEQLGLYIEPVQLQVVCYRLWEHLPDGAVSIAEADIGGTGDVNSALEAYYGDSVSAIASDSGVAERAVRDWCGRSLITAQGIRGQVVQGREVTEGLPNRAVEMLVDRHLVRAEKRHGVTWFELAHDRLMDPVRSNNAKWRESHLTGMQKRAALWEEQRRPASLLILGAELAEARRWAAAQSGLTDVEHAFLKDSETAQQGAEREQKQSQRIRQLAVAACVVALCAIGAFVWVGLALRQERLAEQAADLALRQERLATQAANKAQAQEIVADSNAQSQTSVATAERLASTALAARTTQLDTARLLSAAAYRMQDTPETRSALLSTAAYESTLIASIVNGVAINDVAISPDGKRVAIAGVDGSLNVYDYAQRNFQREAAQQHLSPPALSIAFSADGQEMATASGGPAVTLWHWSGGSLRQDTQLASGDGTTSSNRVAFTPVRGADGWLAVATNHGLKLWDWRKHGMESGFDDNNGPAVQTAFSADGRWVAAGYSSRPVRESSMRP